MGACARCHAKKIKCDRMSNCLNCVEAGIQCEPHSRHRTVELYKGTQKRVAWLEKEIASILQIDCRSIKTGTSLKSLLETSNDGGPMESNPRGQQSRDTLESNEDEQQDVAQERTVEADASATSLLTLNATGEMRYLGPSSGSFFASYATSLARSNAQAQGLHARSATVSESQNGDEREASTASTYEKLSPEVVRLLSRSFQLWTLPVYPLFSQTDLENLVARCWDAQPRSNATSIERSSDMIIFLLVMALGAINATNTIKQLQDVPHHGDTMPSASRLYQAAIDHFEENVQSLRPNLPLIQILLLTSIYSSYGPSGVSQWQLAGLAMRMAVQIGLHCSHLSSKIPRHDVDRRNRAFWTAYITEVTLAYNLGRPPSIIDDHITANFPESKGETAMSLHYVKHRQIQSKIIAFVYCTNSSKLLSTEDRLQVISNLQEELDVWKSRLHELYPQRKSSAYPFSYWDRLYHGTSFVLHRSSPLCPHPSSKSAERCIRSAGTYIESLLAVLRTSNVPLTWMLVQGALFAGITMLVTVRTMTSILIQNVEPTFLLVDFANWTRQCSICIAIMTERWNQDLLPRLEADFESLASSTLKMLTERLTQRNEPIVVNPMTESRQEFASEPAVSSSDSVNHLNWADGVDTSPSAQSHAMHWQSLAPFSDFLGFDDDSTFWNIFPSHSGFDLLESTGADEGQIDNTYIPVEDENQDWANLFPR